MSKEIKFVSPSDKEIEEGYNKALKEALKPLEEMGFFACIYYQEIQHLEGRLLTIIDAAFVDREQRKAVKDLVRKTLWIDWAHNLEGKCGSIPTGVPIVE